MIISSVTVVRMLQEDTLASAPKASLVTPSMLDVANQEIASRTPTVLQQLPAPTTVAETHASYKRLAAKMPNVHQLDT